MPDLGWTASIGDLLGAPVGELTAENIRELVEQSVRETDELDFKATLYGKAPENKVELCKDIAGMRNHRGGVTILGVGEKDAAANGCPEVDLSDTEERRMRQVVAAGTAPHAAFEILAVEGKTSGKGFYLLIAEPSPQRPHAVLVDDGLRYPRRDGTTTRYLSEAEVAAMYRDRFRGQGEQTDRLEQITEETRSQLKKDEERTAWLTLSIVPNSPGETTISFAGRAEIEHWAWAEHSNRDLADGFFPELPPTVGVSVDRYTLTSPADEGKPSGYPYAACYTDGAAAVATPLRLGVSGETPILFAPHLVLGTARALRIAGRHAVRNTGARGDAVVDLRVFGPHMLLGYAENGAFTQPYRDGVHVREARARLTLPLQSLSGDAQSLLAATRLAATPIFNAFGRAEVPHLTPDGDVRRLYFHDAYEIVDWAEKAGVLVTDERVGE